MNVSIKAVRKAACFFCALTVLTVSVLWLIWGIKENSKYHKITAKITYISDFSTENSNYYKDFESGLKYAAAKAQYSYYNTYGIHCIGSFTIYETEKDKYSTGGEYILYEHDSFSGTLGKYRAEHDMAVRIIIPLIFAVPALIVTIAGISSPTDLRGIKDIFGKAFIFSLAVFILCTGNTVYTLFIWRSKAIFFSGLEEFFNRAGSILFSVILLVAEIIVWCVMTGRLKKEKQMNI